MPIKQGWYSPRDIYFSRHQVLWLLQHLPMLREGQWPPQPSGYNVDAGIKGQRRAHAYFETPIQVCSELERRLEHCGLDGLLVLAVYCWGEVEQTVARYFDCDLYAVRLRMNAVLKHITGHRFKMSRYRRRPYLEKTKV